MRTILFLMRKEFLQVFRDRTTVLQIFFIPVVQLLVLSNAATFDVKQTGLAIIDEDRSQASLALVARLEGGHDFTTVLQTSHADVAEDAMMNRTVTGVLQVPHGFGADLSAGRPVAIQLQLNAEEGAVAGVVQAKALRIVADFARDHAVAVPVNAVSAQLDLSTRGWFNPSRNYKHYMVPALLVSLTTLIGLLMTAQNITREKEAGTLEQLNVTPISRGQFLAAKLIPFWLLAMVIFTIGLTVGKVVFGIPTLGHVPLVFLSAAVYLVVALGLGLWISTITRTQQQAMFVAFFVLMIFLLMSGLFTPIESMPDWAQRVAMINPVRQFVAIMRAVLVRGAGFDVILPRLAGLGVGGVVILSLAIFQYRKSAA